MYLNTHNLGGEVRNLFPESFENDEQYKVWTSFSFEEEILSILTHIE